MQVQQRPRADDERRRPRVTRQRRSSPVGGGRAAPGHGQSPEPAPWRSRPPLSRLAVARIVQAGGALNVVVGLVPEGLSRLAAWHEFVPVIGMLSARAATIACGLLLVYLGAGLRRGKHRAWQVAVALAAASVLFQLVHGLDLDGAAVSAALLVTLLSTRDRFHAVADPRSPVRALLAVTGFALAGFVLGFAEIAMRANRLAGHPPVRLWAEHAALGLVGVDGPLRFAHPVGAEAVSITTGTCGLLAITVGLVSLLRPASRKPARTPADDARVCALLDQYGDGDSLAYFATRGDKSLAWSPSGKALITYRVLNGVALATGDPIGPPDTWPQAIDAWLAECDQHGWTPAVLGCGHAAGRAYRRGGLDVIELGDEAVIDVAGFTLNGRPMRAVRQAVARVERAGYTCHLDRQSDLSAITIAEIIETAAALRDGPVERGFSMALSRIGDSRDDNCLLVTCRDGEGHLRGVLQFVPWGHDGLSLDLMRGDRAAANGIIETMVVATLKAAPQLGIRRVSMNFAVLRSVFARAEELGAGPALRLYHRLLRMVSRVWQIESLYRANAKYQPVWRPRYLCFPTARELPRIAVAALRAEAFLPASAAELPVVRRFRRRPTVAERVSPATGSG
jgi:lysyl-tRNA synthetase, class II